jgi:methyltransferase (TIGR00027 family)
LETTPPEQLIRNVSDTALWVAVYRARETDRRDAIFRDPFARRLAGERGEKIADSQPLGGDMSWPMVTRTYLIDEHVRSCVGQDFDMVVNLAAGLDARPYRMQLPASLQWVEVDLPPMIAYKEEALRADKPVCKLERISVDLSDEARRRELFQQLGHRSKKTLILTEGLLTYLTAEQVGGLATDLARTESFRSWVLDIPSPSLLRMLQRRQTAMMSTVPFKFAPEEGPQFFGRFGWEPRQVQSLLKTAAQLKRLPLMLRFFSLFPEPPSPWQSKRPWSGVCLLDKRPSH